MRTSKFNELQGELSETEMSEKLGISRSHLWRLKNSNCSVGQEFITKFKKTYPENCFDDYFEIVNISASDNH